MNHSNCVISAVGRNSLHRMWLKGECNFDLHLVVYDDSMEEFRGDTEYICHIKGYKLKVIYRYLEMYPELKERYDYFFFPDDDIQMDTAGHQCPVRGHAALPLADCTACTEYVLLYMEAYVARQVLQVAVHQFRGNDGVVFLT